jgi:transcriptional regulator with XRE-family HTH domain
MSVSFSAPYTKCRAGRRLTDLGTEGLSQEKLALDAGFDRTYISLVERGVRSPTIRAVVKLAQVLNVAPSNVVKRMEDLLASGRRRRGEPEPAGKSVH